MKEGKRKEILQKNSFLFKEEKKKKKEEKGYSIVTLANLNFNSGLGDVKLFCSGLFRS